MAPRRLLQLALCAAALPSLSGCLAAAAIPLAAGGAMFKTRHHGANERSEASPTRSRAPAATAAALASADVDRAVPVTGRLPAPHAAPSTAAAPAESDSGAYRTFAAYVATQAAKPEFGEDRHSALLAAPGTLSPQTATCSIQPPAVLIDLDPAGSTFDPDAAPAPNPPLAQALAALRAQEVGVLWISGATADHAGAIRRALRDSGLDPDGSDELVLVRYAGERKQTRREDVGKSNCVLAIAGDERADFDELYQYLKNPDAALSLEPLFGKGWFLVPQPLR
jgi:hypothetical protein